MERLIQYLDEFEDLVYAVPLVAEQIRRVVLRFVFLLASMSLQIAGIILALKHPPLALAVVTLLLVGLLFRAVVVPLPRSAQAK